MVKIVSVAEVCRLMRQGCFLYCCGAGAIIKQNCSANNTNHKFLGCSHDIKIETVIALINASRGYAQDDYGSIFWQLPNSKFKCEITVLTKCLYAVGLSIELHGKTSHLDLNLYKLTGFFLIVSNVQILKYQW